MTAPLVSVVVPTHNGERFLAETLSSILAQTHPPLEVIVVNDGSEDRSVEIASSFGDPVRIVGQPRGGPASARNLGIGSARGSFIAFLDHDDLWNPRKLELQMAAFAAQDSLDVCVGHIQSFRGEFSGADMEMIGGPVPGYLSVTMLARRQSFDRVGLLDPSREHSDSAEWFLRGERMGLSVRLLAEVLTYHRSHDTNRSLLKGNDSRREFLQLAKARMNRMRDAKVPPATETPSPTGS